LIGLQFEAHLLGPEFQRPVLISRWNTGEFEVGDHDRSFANPKLSRYRRTALPVQVVQRLL
jgi:hypothetical protein